MDGTRRIESTRVDIVKGGTALDVMIAAADQDRKFDFQAQYNGNIGFMINAIGDVQVDNKTAYWAFFYTIPGLSETPSSLGVSSVVIPGNDWKIVMRYTKIVSFNS